MDIRFVAEIEWRELVKALCAIPDWSIFSHFKLDVAAIE